jgi:hypothetical protein
MWNLRGPCIHSTLPSVPREHEPINNRFSGCAFVDYISVPWPRAPAKKYNDAPIVFATCKARLTDTNISGSWSDGNRDRRHTQLGVMLAVVRTLISTFLDGLPGIFWRSNCLEIYAAS